MASNRPSQDRSLYAVLNVAQNASEEEVRAAYRRLSVLFHPDKHASGDSDQRASAEAEFMRVKHAYEVLSDAQQRSIYDLYGEQGLKADWEIVQRVATGPEMLEVYSRLRRLRQEEYVQKVSQPNGTAMMKWDIRQLTSFFYSPSDDVSQDEDEDDDVEEDPALLVEAPVADKTSPVHVGVQSIEMSQSLELPLSPYDRVTYSCDIQTNGHDRGWGAIGAKLDHCILPQPSPVSATVSTGFQVGHVSQLSAGCHLLFPSVCFAYADVAWRPWSRRLLPRVHLGRQFSPSVAGRLEFRQCEEDSPSGEQSLRLVVERRATPSDLRAHVTLGVARPPCVGVKYSPKLLPTLTGTVLVEASLDGVRLGTAVEHAVSPLTRLGMKVELSFPGGVQLTLRFCRGDQRVILPLTVSDEVSPSAVLYSTAIPLTVFFLVRECLVRPYARHCAAEEARLQSTFLEAKLKQKRRENESFIQLMAETFQNSVTAEKSRHGLVILNAWYGRLVSSTDQGDEQISDGALVDVTVALQCLVKDARLVLFDTDKSSLPGFFDPAPRLAKSLRVRYQFRNRLHEVTVSDSEPLQLPKQSHTVQ